MIVAIDGPAGSGKSTISKEVARQTGFSCLDTGAMYRAVAWKAWQEGVPFSDEDAVIDIAYSSPIEFGYEYGNPVPTMVYIDGIDVSQEIRRSEMDMGASDVSAIPGVREALVEQQRRIGYSGDYVVEGRDIGTVVFPDAELKVFLTASPEERARRRVEQNAIKGVGSTDYNAVYEDLLQRDYNDSHRATSPLMQADDAVLLDTTGMTLDEVIDEICGMMGY